MAVATFDFVNLIMKPQNFDTMDAEVDFYSEWKRLLISGPTSNAGAPPAFAVSVGGNPTRPGQFISPYFFIRNDLGWRVEGPAGSGELTVVGNLFAQDVTAPAFQADGGGGTVLIRQEVSPQSVTSAEQLAAMTVMLKMMQNRFETNPITGMMQLYDDDDMTVMLEAPLFEDIAGTQPYRGRGAERRNRMLPP